ncbi:hypothetical protein [Hymenobacter sp. DG01]|uniref:hypothetical protein n=1 Tax=Hymenobacter sp. DG01 TaxID=2584940 RepID=UPI0011206916|nr:hypothetical protein [Hymenobacter sp. DG01]
MKEYLDSISALSFSLKELISGITFGKFFKSVISLAIIAIMFAFMYEYFSSYFFYSKLEKQIKIIEEIKRISTDNEEIKKASDSALLSIIKDINYTRIKTNYSNSIKNVFTNRLLESLLKILAACIIPIIAIISSLKDKDNSSTIIGSIAFIFIFGTISIFIPVIYQIWVNMLLIILAEILVLLPFMNKK